MTGDSWPDAAQTLLLQAALLDGDAGRTALDEWRARVDLDRLDRGSLTLLPLLYQRLVDAGIADPWLPRALVPSRIAGDRMSWRP